MLERVQWPLPAGWVEQRLASLAGEPKIACSDRLLIASRAQEQSEQDGGRVILVPATREQLEGMPTYKTLFKDKQAEADAAVAQQQLQQQQQQGGVPSPGVVPPAPAPAPAPAPSNP